VCNRSAEQNLAVVSRERVFRALSLVLLAVTFAVVLLARNPPILFKAQFWAEDGWFWYPEAYSDGVATLASPRAGYLHTLSRLVALLAQLFPLTRAPTLFAAVAFAVQLAPAVFLVSGRMALVWSSRTARVLFALAYLALPNSYETYVNLATAQSHLALLALLVLTSTPPRGRVATAFDIGTLLLAGLSGPFCLMLLPIALLQLYHQDNSARRWRVGLVLATALVQGSLLIASESARSHAVLGADPLLFARIVATQILGAGFLGLNYMIDLAQQSLWQSPALPLAVALVAAVLVAVAMCRGPRLLCHMVLFAGLTFAAALLVPQVSMTEPQWPLTWACSQSRVRFRGPWAVLRSLFRIQGLSPFP
jgi:hypothetical protein